MFGLPRLYSVAGAALLALGAVALIYGVGWQSSANKAALDQAERFRKTTEIINHEKANNIDPAAIDDSLRRLAE